ncbi:tRNA epoxyqueuosine(34) reductase QueG [Williamwhitmania taraxaci]|uniref:Epoxyqueuosine reductase n=1 Tax=Williamwhitmania taraxaci TaxID=1640674 RepID=A0A1G6KNF8_9BACT|nr:tRNA epoxyqueuosine(34) reductase QueG [Williamwhitmania taraxaci]SDC32513.1 epoxyqueuosine reductase [Williamwhitmania taraxaci]
MENSPPKSLKENICIKAAELGFEAVGFAKAEHLSSEKERLNNWLNQGFQAGMGYMEKHFEMRLNPTLLVEEAKTVISLLYSYNQGEEQATDAPRVARYAWFRDYHKELKQRMKVLMEFISLELGTPVNGRYFTDSAPVLERAWAVRSGLGWIGKNSLLIHPKLGSFTLLAELILDLELEPDQPFGPGLCGACTRCIDSCPTSAIVAAGVVNSNLCISYLTIEHKGEFTQEQHTMVDGHAFGCDICQEVCPWNKKPLRVLSGKADLNRGLLSLTPAQWQSIDPEQFEKIFFGSAVKRAGYSGIIRNLNQQKQ